MKKFWFVFPLYAAVFLGLAILLAGCSSSSDDDHGTTTSSGYSGSTTEAAVTASNATEITKAAFQGNELASAMIRAREHSSSSTTGSCGGTASPSIRVDTKMGTYSGSITFNNFCEAHSIVSGYVSVSGSLGPTTHLTMSFNAVTFDNGVTNLILTGDMNIDYSSPSCTILYDIVAKDNAHKKAFWWKDFIITSTQGTSYEDSSFSGIFYHSDYGYTTISTPTIFRFDSSNYIPSTGTLLLTGKKGTAGDNTSSLLTVLSTTTYQIQADTTGDNTYDWDSGTFYW